MLKTLSAGVDDAGAAKIFLATVLMVGYFRGDLSHHSKQQESLGQLSHFSNLGSRMNIYNNKKIHRIGIL